MPGICALPLHLYLGSILRSFKALPYAVLNVHTVHYTLPYGADYRSDMAHRPAGRQKCILPGRVLFVALGR